MDTKVVKGMIRVIRAERDRRVARLAKEDSDFANEQWLFSDEPFVNELCLMLLVAIRHQVERELVRLAARATGGGKELDGRQYRQRVQAEREQLNRQGWKPLITKLRLGSFSEWESSMETLRLLANCYKHDPSATPDERLLTHLKLDRKVKYASLAESEGSRRGLAASLDLQKDADYCDIAEELLVRADRFLADVKGQSGLSPVKWGSGSRPKDFLH